MRRRLSFLFPLFILIGSCATFPLPMTRCQGDDALLDILCSDEHSLAQMRQLLASSGYSHLPVERAAFLIAEPGGTLQWMMWPPTFAIHETSYRGSLPPQSLAIVHTHPSQRPDPSTGDAAVARRLGIPVVALTYRTMAIVWPDGAVKRVEIGP